MISLTRLNDSVLVVNSELIEFIEAMPDTIITLTTGQKILVKESVEEIIEMVKQYKRDIYQYPIVKE
ncbi:flagellar FlbD family protein [Candidatus Latescibacterota bacterium]